MRPKIQGAVNLRDSRQHEKKQDGLCANLRPVRLCLWATAKDVVISQSDDSVSVGVRAGCFLQENNFKEVV